jgi:hypothetical protein
VKGCLRIEYDGDQISRVCDLSLVEDDHQYGIDIEGFMHYPMTVTMVREARHGTGKGEG